MTMPIHAEALFGSTARKDSDCLSDIDYLLVDDDPERLQRRKRLLEARGFSVSDYDWARLERICVTRTLFAIHLKIESKILIDSTGRLQELLDSCTPKADYSTEFDESLQLFLPLEHIPPGPSGTSWAMDTLAVAFRNSAILATASEGRYLFSMDAIIQDLVHRERISAEEATHLASTSHVQGEISSSDAREARSALRTVHKCGSIRTKNRF